MPPFREVGLVSSEIQGFIETWPLSACRNLGTSTSQSQFGPCDSWQRVAFDISLGLYSDLLLAGLFSNHVIGSCNHVHVER